ncbi:hypothetical protein CRV08_02050 [Halarcobacter ebronensis]|jgi:hypothetical protein|uniref:Uncharacterized protein n=1 Tax=Halarcobacter ebronensis TaxID=1462615 RepID=A0A4V1LRV4_9BACT|nr:hypothetical protein [Halarcobacter ebronensis]RXJ69508.1 hypothetical protein CRV08_02050 [Halarcobacter ebronensis]
MHTIKLNIPDTIYPEIMSLLKNYPNASIVEDNVKPDFIVSSMDEAQKRIEIARESVKKGECIEEKEFWEEMDNHISKL